MSSLRMIPYGPLAVHDTGAPQNVNQYTTVVFLHGYTWHSGALIHLLPFANEHHVRIVLVNRRDYPGATATTEEDLTRLKAASAATPEAAGILRAYIKDRAREVYALLESFIVTEGISQEGGLVVIGWSFGSVFLNALLVYAPAFPAGKVTVASYIKRVVAYDTIMGYPTPANWYSPLKSSSAVSEGNSHRLSGPVLTRWATGYFKHGQVPSELEQETPLSNPTPTIFRMTEEEISAARFLPPGSPGGSDYLLTLATRQHSLTAELRKAILVPADNDNEWSRVTFRLMWGDHSIWEVNLGEVGV